MFVHFNVSEYLLSIKANSYMCSSIKSQHLSKADVQFFIITSIQQTSVQDSRFGTVAFSCNVI